MLNKIANTWGIKLALHLIFWYIVWWFYVYFFGFNTTNLSYVNWFSTILIPVTCFVTYTNIYYLLPRFLMHQNYRMFVWYNLYVLVGAAYSIIVLIYIGFIFRSDFKLEHIPPLSKSLPFILISVYLIVFVVITFKLQNLNLKTLNQNRILENKTLQSQLRLKEEELKVLKMQIHPHFLFNTLNTIYGMSLKKDDYTPELILKLSDLLDYILYQINKPYVEVADELNHLKNYVDLERVRFRDALHVEMNFDDVEGLKIPPMLLIPFVENSFKHGKHIQGILSINMKMTYRDGYFIFSISNTSGIHKHTNKGIGLENIKKRLMLLYPDKHVLNIDYKEQRFNVELKLIMDDG